MPHVIVKLYPGRSEADKARLAEALARTVQEVLGSREASLSVAIEDVAPEDWAEQVYRPEILEKPGQVYKKPGYDPFA
jgi:4-oxalocrotonate tautomerase